MLLRRLPIAIFLLVACVAGDKAQAQPVSPVELPPPGQPEGARVIELEPEEDPAEAIEVRVLVLNYDPILEPAGGGRTHRACRWNSPWKLAHGAIEDLRRASHGTVRIRIVDWQDIDEFPPIRGLGFDDHGYWNLFHNRFRGANSVIQADYRKILERHSVAERVDRGEIHEVWLFGGPYFGYFESRLVGPGAYWCNAPPLHGLRGERLFVVMGFNYERGVGEMLEDFGHRTESMLQHVYGSWIPKPTHAWNRFTLHEQVAPGRAACGNVHFAPNSERDYDWGNPRRVQSTCDDWLRYPDLSGLRREMDRDDWGGGDIRAHHVWWFSHLPHRPGRGPDGKLNNWWLYVFDPNAYPESSAGTRPPLPSAP